MKKYFLLEDSMSHNDRSGQAVGGQGKKPEAPASTVKTPDPKANPADRNAGGAVKKEGNKKK